MDLRSNLIGPISNSIDDMGPLSRVGEPIVSLRVIWRVEKAFVYQLEHIGNHR